MRERLAKLIALGTAGLIFSLVFVFGWHQQSRLQQAGEQLDPAAWAELFPLHYESFIRRVEQADEPRDKLEANPFRRLAWAGHAFSLEYNGTRPHYFSQIDQQNSRRTNEREQPAGCINCHAAEAPELIAEHGWEGLHAMQYNDLRDQLHVGSSCLDCHDSNDMSLRITRPAFVEAMAYRDIDVNEASRQEMRSYVCAQCHVEYYFEPENNQLRLPWTEGLRLDDMESHFDAIGFSDWQHAETGADMIKIQHPEFELHSQGVHAQENIACADCHMPPVRVGGMQITEHWIRSPMDQMQTACMDCHEGDADRLASRTGRIQQRTLSQLSNVEEALTGLIEAIVEAQNNGASDTELDEARQAHRRAQMRWDFIDAENSTGFHASQEAARLLSDALQIARDGEQSARQLQDNQ